jgi:predicted dehydrogenase
VPELGGGALYDIGCYCINLSRMLFGGEPTGIEASVTRDATGTDVLTSALLAFDDDVAVFTCSTRAEPDQRVHIYGTEGRISIGIPFNIPPDRPAEITVTAGGDPPVNPASETLTFAAADEYTIQAERFANSVLDGRPLPIPREDAIGNLRVIDAIFRAGGPG